MWKAHEVGMEKNRMILKEIKEGMRIHCKTEEEAKELIKWAYKCGFTWVGATNEDETETYWDNKCETIYRFMSGHDILWSTLKVDSDMEFSDLITSEEKENDNNMSLTKPEYKGIYQITYFPNERADSVHVEDFYIKPRVFEGIIDNFYPCGKCVFYNEVTEQILVIQYECIRNIYPIKKYKKEKSK